MLPVCLQGIVREGSLDPDPCTQVPMSQNKGMVQVNPHVGSLNGAGDAALTPRSSWPGLGGSSNDWKLIWLLLQLSK